jgi:hypothetical protein
LKYDSYTMFFWIYFNGSFIFMKIKEAINILICKMPLMNNICLCFCNTLMHCCTFLIIWALSLSIYYSNKMDVWYLNLVLNYIGKFHRVKLNSYYWIICIDNCWNDCHNQRVIAQVKKKNSSSNTYKIYKIWIIIWTYCTIYYL